MSALMSSIIHHENGRKIYFRHLINKAAVAGIGGKAAEVNQQNTYHIYGGGDARAVGNEVERRQQSSNAQVMRGNQVKGGLMDILSTLFQQQSRKIGMIIPIVVVSEKHSDTLEITEHPVGVGAAIADHAYKKPSEVVMEVGFAGGGSLLDFADTSAIGLSLGLSPQETYQELLNLQASRIPFDVITGKRLYSNMLIRAMEVTTDKTTENILSAALTLREVLISQTQQISVADKTDMKYGVSTSAVLNTGTKTTKPPNSSLLKSFSGNVASLLGLG